MGDSKNERRGYKYTLEDEKLVEFNKLDYGQRLEWLMKMHRFLRRFMPEESRIIWQKFRRGEI
jgi:hypothetical protein